MKAKKKSSIKKTDIETGEILDTNDIGESPNQSTLQVIPKADTKLSAKRESALSIIGGITTKELKAALTIQTEQRALIQEFIKDNLLDGIDYGRIHVVKNCVDEERKRGSCEKTYHYSKSVLFKPGQEKIFSLFGIQDSLEKDDMAYEMLGNMPGLIAYKCTMFRGDKLIGEGRGAATLGGNQNDPNSTIKKAEKRARMDACLSLGFSAYFTQDLDDPEYKAQRDNMIERARNEAECIDKDEFGLLPRDPNNMIDDDERTLLFKMMTKYGINSYYVIDALKLNGIDKPEMMKSGQARGLMGLIKNNAFKVPENQVIPEEPQIIPDSQDPDDIYKDPPASPSVSQSALTPPPNEPDLVIDDDLKQNLANELDDFKLNSIGKMWFMKIVSGKPFGSIDQLDDRGWRMVYDTIMAIMDGTLVISDKHIQIDEPAPVDFSEPLQTYFPDGSDI